MSMKVLFGQSLANERGKSMAIIELGTDLAGNIVAVHCDDSSASC